MTSIRSQLLYYAIRYRHLFQGKRSKPVFDDQTSISDFRDQCEKSAAKLAKAEKGVEIQSTQLSGIHCEWINPENSPEEKMILYVHGGGYVSGSCKDHRGFVSKFAKFIGIKCMLYDYRLAPEHPYPAAIDDSVRVYQDILSLGYSAENIIFAGESAGGGLCLALLIAIRDLKLPLPSAAVAISPWTDLSCSSKDYIEKNKVSVAPLNSWHVFSKHYRGNLNAQEGYISPLFCDLHGLPPILINSGEYDELFADGEAFYQKGLKSGLDIRFRRGEKMIHCYPLLAPMFPEATDAMDEIKTFIHEHINK